MPRKKPVLMILLGLSVILLMGSQTPVLAANPKPGGTLVWRVGADALGLDPHTETIFGSSQLLQNIYSSLLRYDEKGGVAPELAKSWEISPDGLVYTFHLHDNIYFHNGRKMTSADVKYSFERMLDPATGSARRENFVLVDKIETPDDQTVKFVLKESFAPFLVNFADPWAAIVPREIVEDGSIKKQAVGTGPFMIKKRVPGSYTLLEKNPKYFRPGLPYLDALRFQVIAEDSAIVAAMRSKTADISNVWGKLFELFKTVEGIELVDVPVFSWAMLEFNCSKPPFDNPKLRLALSYAINRQEIIDSVMLGNAKVTAPIPEALAGYAAPWKELPGYQNDYEKAKVLLKEAGYPEGLTFELKTSTAYPPYVPTAQVIQSNLKNIGVNVEIIPLEWGAYIKDITSFETWTACFHSFPSYTPDPDTYLYRWFHSQGAWNIGFSDAVVDEQLDLGRMITDPNSRKIIYHRAQFRIAELAPAVYTWRTRVAYAMQPYVKGTILTPIRPYFDYTWLDK